MSDPGATILVLATFRDGYEAHFVEAALYGGGTASIAMVIDVPSRAAAERMFFEPAYRGIIPLRERAFRNFQMYLAAPGEI
jgi:hypothetical protein